MGRSQFKVKLKRLLCIQNITRLG
eukprot:COSAG05_NODE_11373_length_516_cov_1.805755_1_plen_23_part_10